MLSSVFNGPKWKLSTAHGRAKGIHTPLYLLDNIPLAVYLIEIHDFIELAKKYEDEYSINLTSIMQQFSCKLLPVVNLTIHSF